ncbi:MAG: cytochrome P450 [Pseudomonadota bacterium]
MSADRFIPPKPRARDEHKLSWREYARRFRHDIFLAQPKRLYHAWMAEMRLPFFKSFLVNDPELVREVLNKRPDDFPKSELINASLRNLLGHSVFVTNGDLWKFQRRIIDPAFEGGKVRDNFEPIRDVAQEAVERIKSYDLDQPVEFEREASLIAADIIFRTLFSIPITDRVAAETYEAFRDYQRTQPILNLTSVLRLPKLTPFLQSRANKRAAKKVRAHLERLVADRAKLIAAGKAPDDLATKIMQLPDPETGRCFSPSEMVDQVAIFFLAGHETSASALAWALYLLANDDTAQARVRSEAVALKNFNFAALSKLAFTRDVFRETLRLYAPVPMMVREATKRETFRNRTVPKGSQIVLSSFYLGRHERVWDNPDQFDPDRWQNAKTKQAQRDGYMPFSAGARVCPGAGFAMIEGVVLLKTLIEAFEIIPTDKQPLPVAHLTLRAEEGIYVRLKTRDA